MDSTETRQIKLSRGCATTVDASSFERLAKFSWYTHSGAGEKVYAACKYHGRRLLMHRFLLGAEKPTDSIDHINGDTLDNRLSNLRFCCHAENLRNRRTAKHNKSGYKGVYRDSRNRKWRAQIDCQNKRYRLGSFGTAEQAAIAYNEAASRLHGDFARLNRLRGCA